VKRPTLNPFRLNSKGISLTEVLVAAFAAGIVITAVTAMYLTSLDAWDLSGARLAVQRDADYAMEWIVRDIRAGSKVVIGAQNESMTIYRTTASGDSTMAYYELNGTELRNMHGTILADNVTDLAFTSGNGVKVLVEMTLGDDLGTTYTDTDDKIIEMSSIAVCRNQSLY
jgi:Tfp pilus assembly protein PilW